jgi:hypothetical protein
MIKREPGPEIQAEEEQAEATNHKLAQGKPRFIPLN